MSRVDVFPWMINDQTALPFSSLHTTYFQTLSKRNIGQIRKTGNVQNIKSLKSLRYWDKQNAQWFYYPHLFHSAGHAELDISKSHVKESVLWDLSEENSLMTDSGGFQIVRGTLPKKFKSLEEYGLAAQNWQEEIADFAFTLDAPLNNGQGRFKNAVIKGFDNCLEFTNRMLKQYNDNRKGKTRYLNCLHGYTLEEFEKWLDTVRWFKSNGYALSSAASEDPLFNLASIILMLDKGAITEETLVIHILGVGTPMWMAYATALQRALMKANIFTRITFDNSNPSSNAGQRGSYFENYDLGFGDKPFSLTEENFETLKSNANANGVLEWWQTPSKVLHEVPVSDFFKEDGSSDMLTYALFITSNVFTQLMMYHHVNQEVMGNMDTIRYIQERYKQDHPNNLVMSIFNMVDLVEKVFESQTPMSLIEDFAHEHYRSKYYGKSKVLF